jgi:long-chain acyl-CoA synthetase
MFNLIQYGNRPCLEGSGGQYSYSDVQCEADRMQIVLQARSLVLCLCENSVESLLGYVGLLMNGQVLLLQEADQPLAAVHALIASYKPAYVWLAENRGRDLGCAIPVYRFGHYALYRMAFDGELPVIHERLQLLLTTSGSTGSSKLVRLSRVNLLANAAAISSYLNIREDDVAITTLPFSYSFGLSIVNTHLLAGASIQVTALTPLSRDFWALVQKNKVTSLSGVPYTYEMLRRIKFERFELQAIRYLSQAGGKMSEEGLAYLQKLSSEKGLRCFVMYGQTEATARMAYLPAELFGQKLGSIGTAIPGGRFELVESSGRLISAPNVPGELVYYGANVGLGYANGAGDLARGDDWGGRLATGDLAYRDGDGFYYITGRLNRFVKIFGNRVSLDEVESLLQSTYADCEFVCHGREDCLRINYKGVIEHDVLLSFASKQLGLHRSSISCESIAVVPRLSNGKINYSALI